MAEAVRVVGTDEGGSLWLEEAALEQLVRGRTEPAIVLSVAGPFRLGKSFLLDYCLRYLRHGSLGPPDRPLAGFSWQPGSERHTTGVLLWPEVFRVPLPDGTHGGLLLMDTQGAFDTRSSMGQTAAVFALSTMVSSVQVYNVARNLAEDDLRHLELFAEYAQLAGGRTAPFQRLVFLVRDWAFPYDVPYGEARSFLERRLTPRPDQPEDLRAARVRLAACFSRTSCFLLPHPGAKAAADPTFDGRPADLDPEFLRCLGEVVQALLAPEALPVKTVSGRTLTLQELPHYFRAYVKALDGKETPRPRSVLEATAEADHLAAVEAGRTRYRAVMDGAVRRTAGPGLRLEHREAVRLAMEEFDRRPKMGGTGWGEYRTGLETALEACLGQYERVASAREASRVVVTPVLLVGWWAGLYAVTTILSLVGLDRMAAITSLLSLFFLLSLVSWLYCRLSGEYPVVATCIDDLAHSCWDKAILPAYLAAFTTQPPPLTTVATPTKYEYSTL